MLINSNTASTRPAAGGDEGFGAGAVTVATDTFGSDMPTAVAKVVAHLGSHGAFDESILEILEDVLELLLGHWTCNEMFEHFLGELRQGRFAARRGSLVIARHENSFGR